MWKWKLLFWWLRLVTPNKAHLARRVRGLKTLVDKTLNELQPQVENTSATEWVTTITRPKRPVEMSPIFQGDARCAVVIQGPLRLEDDFTVETVRFYRRSMPGARLIVSTWDTEDAAALERLEDAGATVVCSTRPKVAGAANVNLQICSTQAGLAAAREAGCEFVLKTRTDTRIGNHHVLDYLAGLLKSFPVGRNVGQKSRIAVLDFATRLYIPNHPADVLMFGLLDDLDRYWASPYSSQTSHGDLPDLETLWSRKTPEVYLCEGYLGRIGYSFERTIASWWKTLADLFVVVDRASIDLFWPKYGYLHEHRHELEAPLRPLALCRFPDWVNLHAYSKQLAQSEDEIKALPLNGYLTGHQARHLQLQREPTKGQSAQVLLVQGPIFKATNPGPGSLEALQALSKCPSRSSFRVVYLCWDNEAESDVAELTSYVDDVITLPAPENAGSCHRNSQSFAVSQGLRAHSDLRYAVKCRSDVMLSETYLRHVLQLAANGFYKLGVTNLFTRVEPFHVSDFIVFGRTADVGHYFYDGPAYYEDIYSPEVQFTRSYVRGKGLKYRCTLEDYLRFLRDEVDLVDFQAMGLQWLKWRHFTTKGFHATRVILEDRDIGPLLCRLVTPRFFSYIKRHGKKVLALTALGIQILDPLLRFWRVKFSRRPWSYYWTDGKQPEYQRALEGPVVAVPDRKPLRTIAAATERVGVIENKGAMGKQPNAPAQRPSAADQAA